jgi:hypothetical protein
MINSQLAIKTLFKTILDGLTKSPFRPGFVIPAPYQVRGKLQPESSVFNQLKILWTPVFTGVTTFYEFIILDFALITDHC